eukprot:jgi/Tetstr1/441824/TSEL_030040.t1
MPGPPNWTRSDGCVRMEGVSKRSGLTPHMPASVENAATSASSRKDVIVSPYPFERPKPRGVERRVGPNRPAATAGYPNRVGDQALAQISWRAAPSPLPRESTDNQAMGS